MQYDDLDQSFWDDVDALRAMLEEDESQQAESRTPSFDATMDLDSKHSRQPAAFRIPPEDHPSGSAKTRAPAFESRSIPRQRIPSYGPSAHRRGKAPRRPSKGALITIYTIIFLELGAITAVAYHWYAWIQ